MTKSTVLRYIDFVFCTYFMSVHFAGRSYLFSFEFESEFEFTVSIDFHVISSVILSFLHEKVFQVNIQFYFKILHNHQPMSDSIISDRE